jgi:hypothetical protein
MFGVGLIYTIYRKPYNVSFLGKPLDSEVYQVNHRRTAIEPSSTQPLGSSLAGKPVDVVEAHEAINIHIERPMTFGFSKKHVPRTAKGFSIMLHQTVDV